MINQQIKRLSENLCPVCGERVELEVIEKGDIISLETHSTEHKGKCLNCGAWFGVNVFWKANSKKNTDDLVLSFKQSLAPAARVGDPWEVNGEDWKVMGIQWYDQKVEFRLSKIKKQPVFLSVLGRLANDA